MGRKNALALRLCFIRLNQYHPFYNKYEKITG